MRTAGQGSPTNSAVHIFDKAQIARCTYRKLRPSPDYLFGAVIVASSVCIGPVVQTSHTGLEGVCF